MKTDRDRAYINMNMDKAAFMVSFATPTPRRLERDIRTDSQNFAVVEPFSRTDNARVGFFAFGERVSVSIDELRFLIGEYDQWLAAKNNARQLVRELGIFESAIGKLKGLFAQSA